MKERIVREIKEKRGRYTKHFQMTEKGAVAAVYPEPVHYEEDGEWKEIDNRLEAAEREGEEVYQNKASDLKVQFAAEAGAESLVTLEKEGKQLSWSMEGTAEAVQTLAENGEKETKKGSRFCILTEEEFPKGPEELRDESGKKEEEELPPEEDDMADDMEDESDGGDEILVPGGTKAEPDGPAVDPETDPGDGKLEAEEIQKQMGVPHLVSEGMYEEILPGVDIHYTIQGDRLKENIRLKNREAAGQRLAFHFRHPGMEMRKEPDGSLGLYQGEERAFCLVKPYLYDSKGEVSQSVEMETESDGEESLVVITPDPEWMQAEERVYPVIIDPMTETSKTRSNIEDTYVFSGGTSSEDASKVYAYGSFVVGKSNGIGKSRALLRFKDLPDIGNGSIIYAATMYIWQYEYSTFGVEKIPLVAREVVQAWNEKDARWSNQPGTDGSVLDYQEIGQVKSGNTITITPIGFDVTRLVRKWYNTGKNYGIQLRSLYEDDATTSKIAYGRFYASDHPKMSSDQFPSGVFYYRNVTGLEDYQSYHDQAVGRAGSGATNDFTGNLVWSHRDAETSGGSMTAELQHIYNSCEAGSNQGQGYGWRLSSMQKLEKTGITNYPYVYTDEDGTKHYFYKDTEDGNKLKDEDGLGLTITEENGSDSAYSMIIETKEKVKYIFAKDGTLRFVKDVDENQIKYVYQTIGTKSCLKYVEDGGGAKLEVQYGASGVADRVASVKDMAGRLTSFSYDSAGNLTGITYPDGLVTIFTYDSAHKMTGVTGPDGYGFQYEYQNDFRIPRVSRIKENGDGKKAGQELKVSYENGNITIFEEPGLDGEISQTADNKKTIYHFDNMGRPTDIRDSDGYANSYTYYTSGMKNHKLSKEGSVQKTVYHLLKNPLFDARYTSGDGWEVRNVTTGGKGTMAYGEGYAGTASAKLVKTAAVGEEGICQDVTLGAGTYTFSAYLKTEGLSGADRKGAGVMILHADGSRSEGAERITGETEAKVDQGWERLAVTFTLAKSEKVTVFAGIFGTTGTLYVSGAQLESGKAANKLNLIMNPGFESVTSGNPDYWTYSADVTGSRLTEVAGRGKCGTMNGRWDKALSLWQSVMVSGKAGDVYHVSGWVKAYGIPGKRFVMGVQVIKKAGADQWVRVECNPNLPDWQFACNVFRTDADYKEIRVYLYYDYQMNQSLWDGIQLIRDDGDSYVYDKEGNLVSAKSAAEKDGFTNNKQGSITRMGSIDGTAFEYGYDSKDHLVRAANAEGVRYSFHYQKKHSQVSELESGKVYYLREKSSGNYMDVRNGFTEMRTLVQLFGFNGTSSQQWRVVLDADGYAHLEPQNAPGMRLDLKGASTEDGAAIQIYPDNGASAQRWKFVKNTDGSFQIQSKVSNTKCITNATKSTTWGEALKSMTVSATSGGQSWYLEEAGDEGKPIDMRVEAGRRIGAVTAGRTYYIREKTSGNYMDVKNGATSDKTPVQLYPFNGTNSQKWKVVDCEDGYLKMQPLNAPGMVLDLNGGSNADGTAIQIYSDIGSNAQRWKLQVRNDGSYKISSKATEDKKVIANAQKSVEKNVLLTSITLAEYHTGQDWYFEPADEGTISDEPADQKTFSFRVRQSGQYLEILNNGLAENTKAIQRCYNGGPNQMFRMRSTGDGYYQMEPLHAPGMVLAKNGENLVIQKPVSGAAGQRFRFEEIEKGKGYLMICKDGNGEVGVKDQSYTVATELVLSAHNGTPDHKRWILEEYSDRMEASMEYTSDGRQVQKTKDARGYETSYTYDAQNRLMTSCTDALGGTTRYAYDAATDQMTKVSRTADGTEHAIEYTYEKDKIHSITRNGVTYGYVYDAYGNQTGVTVNGKILEETVYRNKNGLEDQVTYATGEAVRNEYDAEERLSGQYLLHADGTEEKLYTNTYDHEGNVVLHKDERNQMEFRYQYDLIGRILGSSSSDGMKLKVAYDKKNRVEENVYRLDGKGHSIRYLYGDPEKQQKPGLGYGAAIDGTERLTYEYDLLGRYAKKTITYPSGSKGETTYTYVPGTKEGVTTALVQSITEGGKETSYTYDGLGNITEIVRKDVASKTVESQNRYQYDGMNQLVREEEVVSGKIFTYSYDAGGNLQSRKCYQKSNGKESLTGTDTYRYGGSWKDQLTAYNGKTITYDAMGNPLQYLGMTMSWEKGRQLKKVTKNGTVTTYGYDSDGNRIQKTTGGKTTRYYLNGSAVIAQKEEGGNRLDYLYDDKGNLFALEYEGALYFYQLNLQGDVTGLIDSTGKEVVRYRYDSWGRIEETRDDSGKGLGKKNPFRYRGYYYDEETGLYYLNERYYDPEVRRFVNADDVQIVSEQLNMFKEKNLYTYCNNNPILFKDEMGTFSVMAIAISGALNVAISYIAAKATGQSFGVSDFIVAFAAGGIGAAEIIHSAVLVKVAAASISALGTVYSGWKNGESLKEIAVKTAINSSCAVMSVSTVIGAKKIISQKTVETFVNTVFDIGNSLIGAAITTAYANQRKSRKKKGTYSKKAKISKKVNKSKKRRINLKKVRARRIRRYYMRKMEQLRQY